MQRTGELGPGTLVSVIITCFNGEKYIAQAIESVLSQTYQPFEIIVVDDGSTDGSEEVASAYADVLLVRQENKGISAARNRGHLASRGDLVVFLDHDDRLLPNALRVGVQSLGSHPECGFVYGLCQLITFDGSPLPSASLQAANYTVNACYELQLAGKSLVPPSTAMFRRSVFEEVGGYNLYVDRAQDYDLYLRISRSHPIYCHNNVVVEYRLHSANRSRNASETLRAVLAVLDSQLPYISGVKDYEAAYRRGTRGWRRFFGRVIPYQILRYLLAGNFHSAFRDMVFLLLQYPQGYISFPVEVFWRLCKRVFPTRDNRSAVTGS